MAAAQKRRWAAEQAGTESRAVCSVLHYTERMALEQTKAKRHPGHPTQWAAQFAVASDLCKRGYEVALTLGNHPLIDLMVISPKGVQFQVDVKGQYKRNFWPVRQRTTRDKLFYGLAFVPTDAPNQFFILTQEHGQQRNPS